MGVNQVNLSYKPIRVQQDNASHVYGQHSNFLTTVVYILNGVRMMVDLIPPDRSE